MEVCLIRQLNTFFLKPGMQVGRTIYSSRGEILLKAGVKLNNMYIKRLVKLGIPDVYIEDGLLPDVPMHDVITQETRVAAVKQVRNILLETKESGRLVIAARSLYNTVGDFADELLADKSIMFNLVDLRSQDDYTFAHSVNVCVLSLMTGITLGYKKSDLATLGVSSLLHDLGKTRIPDYILNKPGSLTPEEYSLMKMHTTFGYEMIRSSKDLTEIHATVAHQHHESFDGSGYPLGIKNNEFHELAQITSIADKFDALTANRIYRRAFPPHEAYEMCAGSGNYLFKDEVVKAFLYNIAAYPSGALVELNSGEVAVVMDTPKGLSLFPRVRILFDQDHQPLACPVEKSLHEVKNLNIVKVLSDAEALPLMKTG